MERLPGGRQGLTRIISAAQKFLILLCKETAGHIILFAHGWADSKDFSHEATKGHGGGYN
jgi:hypothetical protein